MEESVEIQTLEPSDLYQHDKALIDMQVATAKAYPRNIKLATEEIVALVSMDKETAQTCIYSLPRGGKSITGPSVHLAKIIAQSWGNMRIEARITNIGDKQITSQAVAFDLEKNLAIKVEVKRSIMQNEYIYNPTTKKNERTGRQTRMNDDMITMTGNAANSIALRNAVYAVVPRSIVDKAMRTAKETITGDISDETKLIAKRKKVVDALVQTYSVTEDEVIAAVGKAAVSHLTGEDLVTLIGIGEAIKDGEISIDNAFRPEKAGKNKPDIKANNKQKEEIRIKKFIEDAKTMDQLEQAQKYIDTLPEDHELIGIYLDKVDSLSNGEENN
jgi:hypothetical protein